MADINPVRRNIQFEETWFRAAVSESTAQKIGSSINFINNFQYSEKSFYVNGQYNTLVIPFLGIDGLTNALFDMEIIGAFMFIRQAGSSGTTELDVKYATTSGGTWTSIFSTTPKINYAAGNFAWCYIGSSFLNTTAPVLSTPNIDAGSALRLDILQAQSGDARGCGLVLNYRPR